MKYTKNDFLDISFKLLMVLFLSNLLVICSQGKKNVIEKQTNYKDLYENVIGYL
jgi:hypothetical protein